MAKASILIIDDDETIRYFLPRDLEAEGFQVQTAETGLAGLRALEREPVDLVLLDIRMPDLTGIEVLKKIREQWPDQIVVMLTGEPDHETAVQAMRLGARDYLTKGKPIREELLLVLGRELSSQRMGREVQHHRRERSQKFSRDFVRGESAAMQRVYSVVEQVATSESTSVLIQGESGTGKELIAHWVHDLSARRDKAMLEVNCAAIPRELLESELFGHEKGAFTDARQQKQGLLELANGGTLFLDEVGDMSPSTQAKILRVLQEHEFERLGGTRTLRVDVRIIAATNRNLTQMVQEGRFREDLFYRLNVVSVETPPLRDRKDDIAALADFFVKRFATELKKKVENVHPEAQKLLMRHNWPGNIRELENVIERAVLLADHGQVTVNDLQIGEQATQASSSGGSTVVRIPPTGIPLEEIERQAVVEALKMSNWVQKDAAELLGISPRVMNYKIKILSIEIPRSRRVVVPEQTEVVS